MAPTECVQAAAMSGCGVEQPGGAGAMAGLTGERVLLTVEEAAHRLGIGRSFAWELVRRGELPSIRLGRLVRIPVGALDEWIQRKSRGQA